MKARVLIPAVVALLMVTACPQPTGPGDPEPDPVVDTTSLGDVVYVPQLNVLEGRLDRLPPGSEYSLDDGSSWQQCNATSVTVAFQVGDKVWLRPTGDDANKRFLGKVEALSGRPDFVAGDSLHVGIVTPPNSWSDVPHGARGDSRDVMFYFLNCGDASGYSWLHRIRVYLSTDKIITPADTLLTDIAYDWTCPIGKDWGDAPFTVPAATPGTYFIGMIVDATDVIPELSEGAASSPGTNTTQPEEVVEFRIVESSVSAGGAFKIVNSWGEDPLWENKPDGHYWMTYSTIKRQGLPIYYYYNDFTHVYKPTILAVFELTHPRRDECQVTVGLGDPTTPVAAKNLMVHWGNSVYSGAHPFPSNSMAMDISEFAALVNDYDLFLTVENTGPTACSINGFQVEFYADYDSPPFKTITGGTGQVPATATGVVYCSTQGALNLSELMQILPLTRATGQGISLIQERPDAAELLADMARVGVYQEGWNYNKLVYGRYGTGFQPPTAEAWGRMQKLRRIEGSLTAGVFENLSIDHSLSQYFPPIGNQGAEGSCTCFALGYYIGTYLEAREHGWDLSSVSWVGSLGAPDSELEKILSPDFLYHQINHGIDEGSRASDAASLIIQLGCASWQEMPYSTSDWTSWPSETAFRDAARYRGRQVGNNYWAEGYSEFGGYFVVENDEDIGLLLGLLEAGYCVSTAINASETYSRLDANDVIDTDDDFSDNKDHAQTIVGFKDGTAWDPSNPD